MNRRAKGCRVERQAAKYLTSLGFPADRAARNGKRGAEDIDCEALSNVHIEVKGDQDINLGTKALDDALIQAADGAGCVLWKHNRTAWRLTLRDEQGHRVTYDTDEGIKAALLRLQGHPK